MGCAAGPRRRARAASTSTCASSGAGASTRCAARRSRSRARSSGARPTSRPASGGRRSATASSSTTTRTRRTAPWPRPTRCGPTPDARVSMPLDWDEVADCDPAAFTLVTVPALFAERGDASARDRRRGRLARAAPRALRGAGGGGPGRRAVAAALREAGRRAAARRAVAARRPGRRRNERAAGANRRSRSSSSRTPSRRTTRSPASSAGRRATPRPRRASQPDDVLVDAMRGRSSTWTRIRVNLRHVPEERAPAAGAARSRLRPVATRVARPSRHEPRAPKTRLELVGRRDLELVVAAILRPLVGPPAHELRGVPEARPCMWSYDDLARRARGAAAPSDRSLPRFHRLAAPGRRCPFAAASSCACAQPRHGWPSSAFSRSGASSSTSSLAHRGGERRGDADVVERALVVVEPEQERADHRSGAVLVPAKAGDDAVGRARVLDLDHRALAGRYGDVEALRHDAVEPGALEAAEPVLGERAIARRRREVDRRRGAGRAPSRAARGAPRERRLAQVLVAERQEVPGDERRRRLLRQELRRATRPGGCAEAAPRSRARRPPTMTISPSSDAALRKRRARAARASSGK